MGEKLSPTADRRCGTDAGYKAHARRYEFACHACREAHTAYAKKFSAYRNAYMKRYRASHVISEKEKEDKKIYLANWNKVNQDKARELKRRWKSENPEIVRMAHFRYKALKRNAPSEPYTTQQILDLYGTDCHLCHEPIDLDASKSVQIEGWQRSLHLDHVIPLSRGGSDLMANVKPSHAQCNLRKNNRMEVA